MAEIAYQLERFAPSPRPQREVQVRVAKKRRVNTAAPVLRMVRVMAASIVVVALVCGVLYTQASLTELQGNISSVNGELTEAQALNAYLSYELENMSNVRSIEERAEKLGLVKTHSNQMNYVRVDEGNRIQVKENALDALLNKAKSGLLSTVDQVMPPPLEEDAETG